MLQLNAQKSHFQADLRPAEGLGARAEGDPDVKIGCDALDRVIDYEEDAVSIFEPIVLVPGTPDS